LFFEVLQWHPVLTVFRASFAQRTAPFSMRAIMGVRWWRCTRTPGVPGGTTLMNRMSCHCWVMSASRWWWKESANSGLVCVTWIGFRLEFWTLVPERKPLIGFTRWVQEFSFFFFLNHSKLWSFLTIPVLLFFLWKIETWAVLISWKEIWTFWKAFCLNFTFQWLMMNRWFPWYLLWFNLHVLKLIELNLLLNAFHDVQNWDQNLAWILAWTDHHFVLIRLSFSMI